MIRVLHVCESDLLGGGSLAAYRLHSGLLAAGINSKMLVANKISQDTNVILQNNTQKKIRYKISNVVNIFFRNYTGFYKNIHNVKFPGIGVGLLSDSVHFDNCDVVHLHWIYRNILSIKDIAKIRVPVVWTLHDLWAVSDSVIHYYSRIANGLAVNEIPSLPSSIAEKFIRFYKQYYWKNIKSYAVGPSIATTNIAKTSPYFDTEYVRYIGLYIDSDYWTPGNKTKAQTELGLRTGSIVCCFGATNIDKNYFKGMNILVNAIAKFKSLSCNRDIQFICFGSNHFDNELDLLGVTQLGKVSQDDVLRIYQASDFCLIGSLVESASLVIQESMCCATPCISLPVGSVPEKIQHKISGYIVNKREVDDYLTGIQWLIEDLSRLEKVQCEARNTIIQKYSQENTIYKYIELYNEMVTNHVR